MVIMALNPPVSLTHGVTGLWRRPGPSVVTSDANVIKGATKHH